METTDLTHGRRKRELPLSGMLLVKLGRAVQQRFNEALKPSELTPRHLQVLDELRHEPISQQALAERVGVDPTNLVGLLNDLEEQQLVLRRRDRSDRRRHIVAATQEGEARVADALAAAAAVEDELLAALDQEQRAQLQQLLLLAAESRGLNPQCSPDPAPDKATDVDGGEPD